MALTNALALSRPALLPTGLVWMADVRGARYGQVRMCCRSGIESEIDSAVADRNPLPISALDAMEGLP